MTSNKSQEILRESGCGVGAGSCSLGPVRATPAPKAGMGDKSISAKAAFTLIELLVVVAMIAVVTAAISTSFAAARTRARIQKATSEVKTISQAILSYETWNGDELQEMHDVEASGDSLAFLLGRGSAKGVTGTDAGGEVPALLMAQLRNGGKIVDPWGTPYRVTVRGNAVNVKFKTVTGALNTGYWLPNMYHSTEGGK